MKLFYRVGGFFLLCVWTVAVIYAVEWLIQWLMVRGVL